MIVKSRSRTRVTGFIFYDENCYVEHASFDIANKYEAFTNLELAQLAEAEEYADCTSKKG